jgi:hypothetical protein
MLKLTLNEQRKEIHKVNLLKTSSSSDDKILSSKKKIFLKQYRSK